MVKHILKDLCNFVDSNLLLIRTVGKMKIVNDVKIYYKNAKEACVDILPAYVALYVVVWGCTEYFHKLQHDHRD